jgi:cobalamin biosynthesis Co2+ chelatase CbiK
MVSDMVLLQDLPDSIKKSAAAYTCCIGGASLKNEYLEAMKKAGFKEVKIVEETTLPLSLLTGSEAAGEMIEDSGASPEDLMKTIKSVVSVRVQATKK